MADYTCPHVHTPVRVGEYTVYATASREAPRDSADYARKDVALYLDAGTWGRYWGVRPHATLKEQVSTPVDDGAAGECYVVGWADGDGLDAEAFRRLVDVAVAALKSGRSVEAGCIGAHGRTGTLLAGLLVAVEGLTAAAAVAQVRARYCEGAVEEKVQEETVARFARELARS